MVQMVAELLRQEGHEVFPFTNGSRRGRRADRRMHRTWSSRIFISTRRAPTAWRFCRRRAHSIPPAVVIVITGFGSIETAVEAMKNGAFDYLEKPFKVEELKLCVQRALSYNAAVTETVYLRKQLKKKYQFSQIIGSAPEDAGGVQDDRARGGHRQHDPDPGRKRHGQGTGGPRAAFQQPAAVRAVRADQLQRAAGEPARIRAVRPSPRRRSPARSTTRKGCFEEADGGTIFLDEVGSMSPMLQSRLLRVLQEREVRRVGENTPIYVNVRVVAASNEPLEKRIKEGTFREDLYYRLNVIADSAAAACGSGGTTFRCWWRISSKTRCNARHQPAVPGDPPGDGDSLRLRLAGQCARAGKRHRAGGDLVRRRDHPGATICRPASLQKSSVSLVGRGDPGHRRAARSCPNPPSIRLKVAAGRRARKAAPAEPAAPTQVR